MAKGYDRHQERKAAVAALGRDLARRAKSRCELCGAAGVPLAPWEVPPAPDEPSADRAALLCATCRAAAEGARLDPAEWRHLETAMWSETPAAQVVAVRLLRRLAADGVPWARDALDALYLDPDIEAWVDQA